MGFNLVFKGLKGLRVAQNCAEVSGLLQTTVRNTGYRHGTAKRVKTHQLKTHFKNIFTVRSAACFGRFKKPPSGTG
jgi:hypothetical protein